LGLQPHYLTDEVIGGMLDYVRHHANQINSSYILPQVRWT
jgi:hypothetical protein